MTRSASRARARDRRILDSRAQAQAAGSSNHSSVLLAEGPVEGSPGFASGVVLPMQLIGDGNVMSAYTVTAYLGSARTPYQILVDSGSSDLWLASTSCSSQVCSTGRPQLYDASSAKPTGHDPIQVSYLVGAVEGPIVWDRVEIGGYSIETQALIAATSVDNEPLSDGFTGILGLALERGSQISYVLPSVTNDDPDGAPFWSNIHGAVPYLRRFFSVSLARPGFDTIPSLLGIGMHPTSLVKNEDDIKWNEVIPGEADSIFWRLAVRGVTAYVNGKALPIDLGRSKAVPDTAYAVAVLDTGGPVILASTDAANAIYGAFGISPPANGDGHYYMPCSTMMNLSLTIGAVQFPLHPLDMSYQADPSSTTCTGTIVASDSIGGRGTPGDIILGVQFLRNVYTVLEYSPLVGESDDADQRAIPQIGLLSLTDPTKAIEEWHSVRVDHVPLRIPTTSSSASTAGGPKPLSIGLEVLFGIIGFFVLCAVFFLVRWLLLRRRSKAQQQRDPDSDLPSSKDLALALSGAERYNATRNTRYSEPSDVTTLRYDEQQDGPKSGKGSYVDEYGLTPRSSRRSDSNSGREGDRYSWVSNGAVAWPEQARDPSRSPERVHHVGVQDSWRSSNVPPVAEISPTTLAPAPMHTRSISNESQRGWRGIPDEPKSATVNDPLLPASPVWPAQDIHEEDAVPRQFAGVGTYATALQTRRQSTVRSSSFTAAPAVMSPLHAHRPLIAPTDADDGASSSHKSWDSGGENGHDRT